MIPYGSLMSHVLQCTQFEALIVSRSVNSYTPAGQKWLHGFPYSAVQRVTQISGSRTTRWQGWSSSCFVPEW